MAASSAELLDAESLAILALKRLMAAPPRNTWTRRNRPGCYGVLCRYDAMPRDRTSGCCWSACAAQGPAPSYVAAASSEVAVFQ